MYVCCLVWDYLKQRWPLFIKGIESESMCIQGERERKNRKRQGLRHGRDVNLQVTSVFLAVGVGIALPLCFVQYVGV